MTKVASLVLLALIAILLFAATKHDEFGRNVATCLAQATVLSLVKGLLVAVVLFAIALVSSLVSGRRVAGGVDIIASLIGDIVDSVPAIIWVLVFAAAIAEPRQIVPVVGFTLVALPYVLRIVHGEVSRISLLEYVQAAEAIGATRVRIYFTHILPNSTEILVPVFLQLVGSAIALDGAIGLLSGGNRTDLNLGTFLIRGKEQFLLNPSLLLTTLAMYALLYFTLDVLMRRRGPETLSSLIAR